MAALLLKTYKLTLSNVFYAFGVRCRHEPTCSEYAAEAMTLYGIWPAFWMAVARVIRCRPGGSQGYDPVPDLPDKAEAYLPWRYGDWRGPR